MRNVAILCSRLPHKSNFAIVYCQGAEAGFAYERFAYRWARQEQPSSCRERILLRTFRNPGRDDDL